MPDSTPKYQEIVTSLVNQIVCRTLPPGAEVPGDRQLAARWGVARPTAAKALRELHRQGYTDTRPGLRAIVRDSVLHEPGDGGAADDLILRGKGMLDGAATLAAAAARARQFGDWLQELHDKGFVLRGPVEGDHGYYHLPGAGQ